MGFLKSMLQDGVNGSCSSKRVITFLAFLLCAYAFVASIHGYEVKEQLFDSMIYLVIAGLGFTASEKFAKKDKPNE
jgi:hypothetical protein